MSKKKKKHKKVRFVSSVNVSSKGFNSLSNDDREVLAQQLYELRQAMEKGDIETAMDEFENMSSDNNESYTENSIDNMISDLLYGDNNTSNSDDRCDCNNSYNEPVFQGDRVLNNNKPSDTDGDINLYRYGIKDLVNQTDNEINKYISDALSDNNKDIDNEEDEDFDDEYITCDLITHAMGSYADELFSLDNDTIISEIDNFTEVMKTAERIYVKMLLANGLDMENILLLRKRMFEDMGLKMPEEISNIEVAKSKLYGYNETTKPVTDSKPEVNEEIINNEPEIEEPEEVDDDDDLDIDDNGWSDVSVDNSTEEISEGISMNIKKDPELEKPKSEESKPVVENKQHEKKPEEPVVHRKAPIGAPVETISDEELDSVVIMPHRRKS